MGAAYKAHPFAAAAGCTHARMQGVMPRLVGTAELDTDSEAVVELWALAEKARIRREMSFVAENMTDIVGMCCRIGEEGKQVRGNKRM